MAKDLKNKAIGKKFKDIKKPEERTGITSGGKVKKGYTAYHEGNLMKINKR